MEKKPKGRPLKQQAKRLHYSVWVSAEEKKQIDQLVAESNLPASQFFLTQIIEKPIQRPKKKSLPPSVVKQMEHLEKLSGLLALSVLKTKDKEMLSTAWQQSSQHVKWICQLVALRIFEDFDFPFFKNTLSKLQDQAQQLYVCLEHTQQKELLPIASSVFHQAKSLTEAYNNHYQYPNEPLVIQQYWEESLDIHQAIEQLKKNLLKP